MYRLGFRNSVVQDEFVAVQGAEQAQMALGGASLDRRRA
jgi:hypothetical protein